MLPPNGKTYGQMRKAQLIEILIARDHAHAAELRRKDTEIANLKREIDETLLRTDDETRAELVRVIADLNAENEDLTRQVESARGRVRDAETELGEAYARIDKLEDKICELEGKERDGVCDLQLAADGVIFLVTEHLLPKGYESPDEPLHLYETRRALDDLRDAVRGFDA